MTILQHNARHHPRIETSARCWVEAGSTTIYARMNNISLGGVFVRTATPISKGTQLTLRWSFDESSRELEASATVVWVRPVAMEGEAPAGMGVRFLAIDGEQQQAIGAYVSNCLPPS